MKRADGRLLSCGDWDFSHLGDSVWVEVDCSGRVDLPLVLKSIKFQIDSHWVTAIKEM